MLTWLEKELQTHTSACGAQAIVQSWKQRSWFGVSEDHGERQPVESSQSSSETPSSLLESQLLDPTYGFRFWHMNLAFQTALKRNQAEQKIQNQVRKPSPKVWQTLVEKWPLFKQPATVDHEIISHSPTLSLFCQLFVLPAVDYYSHTFPTVAAHFPLLWMVYFKLNATHLLKSMWKRTSVYIFLVISGYRWMPVHATVCPSERTELDWCFSRYPKSLLD